jgi:hypothetical protein
VFAIIAEQSILVLAGANSRAAYYLVPVDHKPFATNADGTASIECIARHFFHRAAANS